MTLDEIQQAAKTLCDTQGWHTHTPVERLAYLIAEVGELAEIVLQLEAADNTNDISNTVKNDIKRHIGHEMYDVIWNVCALANQLEIDVERTSAEKETDNQTRVW